MKRLYFAFALLVAASAGAQSFEIGPRTDGPGTRVVLVLPITTEVRA